MITGEKKEALLERVFSYIHAVVRMGVTAVNE
jgi:hypothetical protein